MERQTELLMAVEEMILKITDVQQEMSRGDFQGRCTVVARDIIKAVQLNFVEELKTVRVALNTVASKRGS